MPLGDLERWGGEGRAPPPASMGKALLELLAPISVLQAPRPLFYGKTGQRCLPAERSSGPYMAKHSVGLSLASSIICLIHKSSIITSSVWDLSLTSHGAQSRSRVFPSRAPGNCCRARPGGAPTSPLPRPVSSLQGPHCKGSRRAPSGVQLAGPGWGAHSRTGNPRLQGSGVHTKVQEKWAS